MNLLKDIPELLKAGAIDAHNVERIEAFYRRKKGSSSNRLLIVFGILGAILVGLGIILILAHNWDDLSRSFKTVISFLPLIIGQLACLFAITKKSESVAWREASASFLYFAVGASIALIAQVYNIPGNLSSYLLTWALLALPIVYLMRSSMVSLLYLAGITYYACESGYFGLSGSPVLYWLLLALAIPYYWMLLKNRNGSNFTVFHHWVIPLSMVISIGGIAEREEEFLFVVYMILFGILYHVGSLEYFQEKKKRVNGYLIIGALGIIFIAIFSSFEFFWEEIMDYLIDDNSLFEGPEFLLGIILLGVLVFLFSRLYAKGGLSKMRPMAYIPLLYIPIYFMGASHYLASVLMNILLLAVSIAIILRGAKNDDLGILNSGLILIALLVLCRFFDSKMSFVLRGVLFVMVGAGFFIANYLIIKRRKDNEQ